MTICGVAARLLDARELLLDEGGWLTVRAPCDLDIPDRTGRRTNSVLRTGLDDDEACRDGPCDAGDNGEVMRPPPPPYIVACPDKVCNVLQLPRLLLAPATGRE